MHAAVLPEHRDWRGLAANGPTWSPEEGALLVVAAHPDDEILGAGGLIRTWAVRGGDVNVLSVSDGEAAEPERRGLGTIRREELTEALRKLCPTHVSVTRLGLPDGRITAHANRLRNAILSLARGKLTLIAPYERDGHPDHEAVGAVCLEFARARKLPIARYAIRHRQIAAAQGQAGAGGQAGADAQAAADRPGEARWAKFLLSDDARRAKARALGCFRSQQTGLAIGLLPKTYEDFLV